MDLPTRGDIARIYDEIAVEFDRTRDKPWPEVVEFAKSLPRSSRVADLGCGSGRHTKVFVGVGHRVVGLDASVRLLSIARSKFPEVPFVRGDLCRLPFLDGKFLAAVSVATIHHLPSEGERLSAMREMARILTPRGKVLVTAWAFERKESGGNREFFSAGSDARDVWIPWRAGEKEVMRFYHLFADGELPELVLAAGLRVAKYFRSGDNYVGVAERHG